MAFTTERKRAGRRPAILLEIEADTCQNTFSVAPCTATGAAGTECFNTFASCQDTPNYNRGPKIYRFAENISMLPAGWIQSIVNVDFAPTIINPGKNLGVRAKITITLKDHPHHDRGIDPYVSARSYDPDKQGSFWGKWLARNVHYEGRMITIYSGYLTEPFNPANFEQRVFVLDQINGPDDNGNVTLIAKDILKLAEDKRALVPQPTDKAVLTSAISAGVTLNFTVSDASQFVGATPNVRIGSEIIRCNRAGNNFTVINRAVFGTTSAAHQIGASVQECKLWISDNVVDIVEELLTVYAGIPAGYIPNVEWNVEKLARLSFFNLTAVISKPEGVTKLLSELTEQGQFSLWWEDKEQLIKLRHSLSFDVCTAGALPELNEHDHIIRDSITIKRKTDERITQIWFYYGLIDYTGDLNKAENFSHLLIEVDTEAESADAFNDKRAKILFSRWMDEANQNIALQAAGDIRRRFGTAPLEVGFSIDAKDNDTHTGDFLKIDTRLNQDQFGANDTPILQVTRAKETNVAHRYDMMALSVIDAGIAAQFGFITPNTMVDYSAATVDQKCRYAWICDEPGFPDGQPCYKIS